MRTQLKLLNLCALFLFIPYYSIILLNNPTTFVEKVQLVRMNQESSKIPLTDDPTAEERKKDHIVLAFKSQIGIDRLDKRFDYEPLFAAHPVKGTPYGRIPFLDKTKTITLDRVGSNSFLRLLINVST